MIRFWDFKLTGAPPLLSWVVRVRHEVADVAVLLSEDRLTAPAVLPAVSYRDRRHW